MEFLKKNYEKVVLGVVLLGWTIAACLLPFIISAKRASLEEQRVSTKPKVKELPASGHGLGRFRHSARANAHPAGFHHQT